MEGHNLFHGIPDNVKITYYFHGEKRMKIQDVFIWHMCEVGKELIRLNKKSL